MRLSFYVFDWCPVVAVGIPKLTLGGRSEVGEGLPEPEDEEADFQEYCTALCLPPPCGWPKALKNVQKMS